MTFSQAHYRLVFLEDGVTDASVNKCIEAAKLFVSLKVDALMEELNPTKRELYFAPPSGMWWVTRTGLSIGVLGIP